MTAIAATFACKPIKLLMLQWNPKATPWQRKAQLRHKLTGQCSQNVQKIAAYTRQMQEKVLSRTSPITFIRVIAGCRISMLCDELLHTKMPFWHLQCHIQTRKSTLSLWFLWLDILPWTLHSFEHSIQFIHVLALYDPFGVDVPLNFDITYSIALSDRTVAIGQIVRSGCVRPGSYPRRHTKDVKLGGLRFST